MFRDESKTCSSWRLHNSASIIYHLKASTKVKHQSCLLLLNSSDLLIPKVWLMDNSFYLWVKYNQYLESFVCLCTVWEITSAGPEKKMGDMKCSAGKATSAWSQASQMAIYHSGHSLQTYSLYLALNNRKEKKVGIKIATLELDSIGGKEFKNNTRSLENRSRRLCRKCLKCLETRGNSVGGGLFVARM